MSHGTLPHMPKQNDVTWGHSTVETACPLDCPDTCSLAVSVERGRIVKIDGSMRQPVTDGYICAKVRRFGDRVYGKDRLRHAGIRLGTKGEGRFKQATWEQALDTIATRIAEIRNQFGAEAILPFSYGGSNGLVSQDTADAELFRRLGTSRRARTVCNAPTGTAFQAMYGKMPGVTYGDYRHARFILIWGSNPSSSGIHLVPHIRAAVKNGATLIVIDPRRTPLARQADIHLPVRPGTDVAVALAIHRFLFENDYADQQFLAEHAHGTDRLRKLAAEWTFDRAAAVAEVDAELIERVAELYAETSPAVIRCGWGLERNRNGGNAAMAVLALPTVAGKFGVRGGGFSMSNSDALKLAPSAWIGAPEPNTRVVNMNHLGRALNEYDDPPIKMLFVYNCNPAATMPDQNRVLRGLKREDLFTVVFDQVMTDTARYADIVLPATTFLEQYDVAKSYGLGNVQLVQPVINAVGEARPNVEVFSELAARLGIEVNPMLQSDPEALMQVAGAFPDDLREDLMSNGIARGEVSVPVQFVDVFPRTSDGKVDLFPDSLEQEAPEGLYRYRPDPASEAYPLALISPASGKTITSILGELRPRLATLQLHPGDAARRDLSTGDMARVFNASGEVHCPVTVNPHIKRGVVSLPKGLWHKSTMNGSTANALVPDTLTDLGGGACFNDARVEVARVVTASLEGRQNIAFGTAETMAGKRIH